MARSNAAASKTTAASTAAAAPADVAGSAAPPPAAPAAPVPAGDKADRVNAYHLPSLKTAFDQSLVTVRPCLSSSSLSPAAGGSSCEPSS